MVGQVELLSRAPIKCLRKDLKIILFLFLLSNCYIMITTSRIKYFISVRKCNEINGKYLHENKATS